LPAVNADGAKKTATIFSITLCCQAVNRNIGAQKNRFDLAIYFFGTKVNGNFPVA
jgi:hypothetical protein